MFRCVARKELHQKRKLNFKQDLAIGRFSCRYKPYIQKLINHTNNCCNQHLLSNQQQKLTFIIPSWARLVNDIVLVPVKNGS